VGLKLLLFLNLPNSCLARLYRLALFLVYILKLANYHQACFTAD